jgi:hypothetical protein
MSDEEMTAEVGNTRAFGVGGNGTSGAQVASLGSILEDSILGMYS